ncbi:MAG: 4a-hydroxytetrahydrobiopterin dehydratase [Acidimicrobiia bacterium]
MRISEHSRSRFLADHPMWVLDGETISRTFVFSGFPEAISFVINCADAAEELDHHPDIDIRWNKVTMVLSTHSESALTSKDTDLAATFDAIAGTSAPSRHETDQTERTPRGS